MTIKADGFGNYFLPITEENYSDPETVAGIRELLKTDHGLRIHLLNDIITKMYDGHFMMAELMLKRYFL